MNLRLVLLGALAAFGLQLHAVEITGAGSTFVYPVLAAWANQYKKDTGHAINYQSIGSGGGIKQIQSKTVTFGATDMPLKKEDLDKDGLVQFPLISGAVVPVVHIDGVANDTLKLSGEVIADIYLGKIKKWNDPALVKLNPDLKLPDQAITVVHRSDGSGTTFIWTNYLAKVNGDWKTRIGEGSAVNWSAGVGGKGNEGVASYVKQINGSIGYVEYAYALQNKMSTAQVKNAAGKMVTANSDSFKAAAAGADWGKADNFYLILTNAPGDKSWPIAGSTFILMHRTQANAQLAKETLRFFRWAMAKGEAKANELHYVPLSASAIKLVEKTWQDQMKTSDGASVTTGL